MGIVAVQLTGRGVGAIAVVLVAGAGAREFLRPLLGSERARGLAVGEMAHSTLRRGDGGEVIDDIGVARVGEERFELHLHGGVAVVEAALGGLAELGARIVEAADAVGLGIFGEGIAGEVVEALPRARGMTGARLVAAQGEEGLAAWAEKWRRWVEGKTANDLWRVHSAVQWVLGRSARLEKLLRPARVAIVGPPNAGKSTLANALLGRPVSITSEMAGTTRDWVDAEAVFVTASQEVDVPVVLVDTAGIRETGDVLEQESIARTHEQAGMADVVVLVFDASGAIPAKVLDFLRGNGSRRVVVVANKVDAGRGGVEEMRRRWPGVIEISALERRGLEQLMQRVLELLDVAAVDAGEAFAFTARQRGVLGEIALTSDPRRIAELLGKLQNAATTEERNK
ncbi:MAG: GTPase [Phycisphaerae bacterium]